MLHLRIIAPTTVSASVRAALLDEPGATHISVQDGAAVEPEGDVIEADVTREAVDRVLDRLLELDLDHTGGVTLQALDTTLSDRATAAEEAVPGDPDDAVIWEQVVARTGDESRLSVSFQAFLTIACLLAAIGAVTNSPVTVVGAMVLGPEFGPLAAVAVGLVLRRGDLIRRGLLALAVGFPIAVAATALAAAVFAGLGLFTTADLDAGDQVDFIYSVGWFSLIVALLAGAAGMLALTSAKSASLVGVFISVTTIPAVGTIALCIACGVWGEASSALAQLGLNLLGLMVAGTTTLLIQRIIWRRVATRSRHRGLTRGRAT